MMMTMDDESPRGRMLEPDGWTGAGIFYFRCFDERAAKDDVDNNDDDVRRYVLCTAAPRRPFSQGENAYTHKPHTKRFHTSIQSVQPFERSPDNIDRT